jgi:hypothetical protein
LLQQDYRSESKREQKLFNKESIRLIKDSMGEKDPRWTDYKEVLDRLNSPELVDFYLQTKIGYEDAGSTRGAYLLFKTKAGYCIDAALFAVEALKRAGYQTFMRHVVWKPNQKTAAIVFQGSY